MSSIKYTEIQNSNINQPLTLVINLTEILRLPTGRNYVSQISSLHSQALQELAALNESEIASLDDQLDELNLKARKLSDRLQSEEIAHKEMLAEHQDAVHHLNNQQAVLRDLRATELPKHPTRQEKADLVNAIAKAERQLDQAALRVNEYVGGSGSVAQHYEELKALKSQYEKLLDQINAVEYRLSQLQPAAESRPQSNNGIGLVGF